MSRAERRREKKGIKACKGFGCGKLRKLNDQGLCRACDPSRYRKDAPMLMPMDDLMLKAMDDDGDEDE